MKKTLIIILLPLVSVAQKNYSDRIKTYMDARERVTKFSGVILAMKGNDTIFKQTYGFADKKLNITNTTDRKFCIGSITKQFTAVSILQLEEQNKLAISDPLSNYFPDFPQAEKVTLHMLLNHTSGLPDFLDKYEWTPDSSTQSKTKILSIIKNLPYQFPPGTSQVYSNAGYYLLGCIIEKVSGQSYSDYLRAHIFKVSNMNNSGVLRSNVETPGMTKDFLLAGETYEFSTIDQYFDIPFSTGGMYSTVEDLYKWDRVLYGNLILTETSKQKMFTPNKDKKHFGYGVIIDTLENHFLLLFAGKYSWYTSHFYRFINDNISIIVLSNNNGNTGAICDAISYILFDKELVLPYVHKEVRIKKSTQLKYIGTYVFKDKPDTIRIALKNDKLYKVKSNRNDIELKPESDTKLFYSTHDNQIEFTDLNDKLKAVFIQSGRIRHLEKIE